jgi:hypothetical protein
MKTYEGVEWTSTLDGGEWSASRSGRFTSKNTAPGAHWIGGWVGLRAGLDAAENRKSLAPAWNRAMDVQPTAQHYSDWAIPALKDG